MLEIVDIFSLAQLALLTTDKMLVDQSDLCLTTIIIMMIILVMQTKKEANKQGI